MIRWLKKPWNSSQKERSKRIFVNPEVEKIENMTLNEVWGRFEEMKSKIEKNELEKSQLREQIKTLEQRVDDTDNYWKKQYESLKKILETDQKIIRKKEEQINYLNDYIKAQDTVLSKIGEIEKDDIIKRIMKGRGNK